MIKHSVLIRLMNCAVKFRCSGSAPLGIYLSGSLAFCFGHVRSWLSLDMREVLIFLFVCFCFLTEIEARGQCTPCPACYGPTWGFPAWQSLELVFSRLKLCGQLRHCMASSQLGWYQVPVCHQGALSLFILCDQNTSNMPRKFIRSVSRLVLICCFFFLIFYLVWFYW